MTAAAPAHAAYPESPVTIVVGAAPGATGDLMARLLADRLSTRWKRSVVVDNKTGGSGMVAVGELRAAPADGYKIYVSNDSPAINALAMGVDHLDNFAPISLLALIDFKLVVSASSPVKTVPELMQLVKASPGRLNYASSGQNTPHHLMAELFNLTGGLQAVHVPYKGTAPSVMSVIAGETAYTFSGFSGVDELIKGGKLRALATTGPQRNSSSPELPTVGESMPGFSAGSWWAMWVRKETPAAVREEIVRSVRAILAERDVRDRLKAAGLEPMGGSPEELTTFMAQEVAKLRKLPAAVFNSK